MTSVPRWKTPINLLLVMSFAMPIAFSTWNALLNNFVIERANFGGAEIGLLQSVREVPGFLAFTAIFLLLWFKEQQFALWSLLLTGLGVAITGYFPSTFGLLVTTFIMSTGFHYFETLKQSLTLQWVPKVEAPRQMGRMIAVGASASLLVYGGLWSVNQFTSVSYEALFLIGGGACVLLSLAMILCFPRFGSPTLQSKKLIFRRRYWLYYALTFLNGARRQIFVVFAGFMMVEKFGYSVADVALLYLINHLFNWAFAAKIGSWIGKVGERRALLVEYAGLIFVFVGYALVDNDMLAAGLYVIDHLFFALAISMSTYFQKIAEPADIASSAGVSFTINHIAAVVIPILFGLLWMVWPAAVFLAGALIACLSFLLALNVPLHPEPGRETYWAPKFFRARLACDNL